MGEYTKMILPIIVTLLITGLTTQVYELYKRVSYVETHQLLGEKYIIKLEELLQDDKIDKKKIRVLEDNWLKHTANCPIKE